MTGGFSGPSLRHLARWVIGALCWLLGAAPALSDRINLSGAETAPNIAEVYVLHDRVKLALEVYVGDLELFEELVPDAWLSERAEPRPGVGGAHAGRCRALLSGVHRSG